MHLEFDVKLERPRFMLNVSYSGQGDALGLFGPSGSGKTTLMHILAGLVRPDRGRVALNGRVLLDTERKIQVPAHQRGVAVVFQEDRLFPHLSVLGNLKYALGLCPAGRRKITLEQAVKILDIETLLKEQPGRLSGGQKQRVSITRALLSSPSLLLLDEPLSALDAGAREAILPYLARLKENTDTDVIIVSHVLEEILTVTDRLLLLNQGKIHDCGTYIDIATRARNREILRTGGILNLLTLVPKSCDAETKITKYVPKSRAVSPVYPNNPVVLKGPYYTGKSEVRASLKPADVSLALAPVEYISIQNQFRGVVKDIIDGGDKTFCRVDIGVEMLVDITHVAARGLDIFVGKNVWVLFKTQSLHLFALNEDTGRMSDDGGREGAAASRRGVSGTFYPAQNRY